jgi:hypothetical protein
LALSYFGCFGWPNFLPFIFWPSFGRFLRVVRKGVNTLAFERCFWPKMEVQCPSIGGCKYWAGGQRVATGLKVTLPDPESRAYQTAPSRETTAYLWKIRIAFKKRLRPTPMAESILAEPSLKDFSCSLAVFNTSLALGSRAGWSGGCLKELYHLTPSRALLDSAASLIDLFISRAETVSRQRISPVAWKQSSVRCNSGLRSLG